MAAVMLACGAVGVPIAIPVLPARALHTLPLQKINYDLAETIAWLCSAESSYVTGAQLAIDGGGSLGLADAATGASA